MSNRIRVEGSCAYIQLPSGNEAVIDTEDLPVVTTYTWGETPNDMGGFYASSRGLNEFGNYTTVYMHRLIAGTPKGLKTDHKNHDTLNNRRDNLQVVNNKRNLENREGANRNSTTGIRGLTIDRRGRRTYYKARVMSDGEVPAHKYFPYTQDGLRDANTWLIQQRGEILPNSITEGGDDIEKAAEQSPLIEGPNGRIGELHPKCKVSDADVEAICERRSSGKSLKIIAEEFKLSQSHVSALCRGKSRKNTNSGIDQNLIDQFETAKGNRLPQTRVTKKQAKEIRKLWDKRELTQPEIGVLFGIAQQTVSKIVTYKVHKSA